MISNIKILRPEPQRFYHEAGSPDREMYILDGDHLIVAGIENSQAIIESYADSTDLNLILKRITDEEYERLINSRRVYMDTTAFPKTLSDIKNQYRDSVAMFDSLPEDVKKELGTLNKFSKMSDGEFEQFILNHIDVKADTVVPESEVSE